MEKIIEQVRHFAIEAHGDQRRKFADEPYIAHLERVMSLCHNYTTELPILCAALLHDVLEDTPTTAEQIRIFLEPLLSRTDAEKVLELVQELTDVYTHTRYPGWNRRKRKSREAGRLSAVSAEAQTIKYADIIDNSQDILNAEPEFARKFLYECRHLLTVMTRGHRELREQARLTVANEIAKSGRTDPEKQNFR
jgi:(p)ppGpp synthase/HD superfamily hydrolase